MVGPGIVSESAEIDSLTCFDEYFCSGYEVSGSPLNYVAE